MDQLWAEAYGILYVQSKQTYLIGEALEIAIAMQKEKMEADEWEGIIEAWLFEDAYSDRYTAREKYDSGILEHRERVCIQEIWEDCLNQHSRHARKYDRNRIAGILHNMEGWEFVSTISFGNRYGRQKGWRNKQPF